MNDRVLDLLPPNATPLEHALVQTAARAASMPVPIRALWNVETCPVELLPWLAWTLALENWDPSWPENVKRARIRHSINVHRRKGTVASVREVVNSFGGDLALREWWQLSPQGEPHTFDVTLNIAPDLPQDQAFQNDIIQAIEQTKPVRSHFTFSVVQSFMAAIGTVATVRPATLTRLNLIQSDIVPMAASIGTVAAIHPIHIQRLTLLQ